MAVASAGTTARAAVDRLAFYPGWVVLALAALPFLAGVDLPLAYQYLPLIASVVLLGLPHGAVDHLVLPRARDEPLSARWLAAIGALYLAGGGAFLAVWFVAPAAAFAGFVLVTLVHWGQGDLYPLLDVGADHLVTTSQRALAAAVRGAIPMAVPLVAFPEEYAFVAGTLVGLFDPDAAAALSFLFTPAARALVAGLLVTLVVAHVVVGYRRATDPGPWRIDAAETLGLAGFFSVVPPVLAIGLYFCFWHSLRHVVRVVLLDERSVRALSAGAVWPALARFARDAAPLTAAALVLFGGLYALVPATPAGLPDLVALYLVLIAALTVPHVVVVTLLDREQGIWRPR